MAEEIEAPPVITEPAEVVVEPEPVLEPAAPEEPIESPVLVTYTEPNEDPFPDEKWPAEKTVLRTRDVAHGGYLRANKDGSVSWRPTSYLGPDIHASNREVLIGALP